MVDQSALQYFNRDDIYPHNLHLTAFQGDESHSSPGIYGAAQSRGTYFVPMPEPDYLLPKKDNIPERAVELDLKKIPQTSQNVAAQISGQQLSNQVGFGKKNESISEDDDDQINSSIDYKSLTKVPDNILNAFDNPKMAVATESFKPKEKKIIQQEGKGAKKKLNKQLKSRMKFI